MWAIIARLHFLAFDLITPRVRDSLFDIVLDCCDEARRGFSGFCDVAVRSIERHHFLVLDQIAPQVRDDQFEIVFGRRKLLTSLRVQARLDFSDICEVCVHVV